MRNQPTNNYGIVRSEIAKRILATPLAAFLRPYNVTTLQTYAEHHDVERSYGLISLEFVRADTNISLYINNDHEWRDGGVEDADGNEYARVILRTETNYPCHGTANAAVTLARLRLYTEVAMLAAELEAEFGQRNDVYELVCTKARREEQAAAQAKKKVQQAAITAMDKVRKAMKVGSLRMASYDNLLDVPDGDYEHEFNDGKKFVLRVARAPEDCMVPIGMVTRTA